MNVTITYTGSSGNSYDLKTDGLRIKKANFHDYSWSPQTVERQYGDKISQFNKSAITYSTTLTFFGTYAERKAAIEALHADFETDVLNQRPGRIFWGSDYIDCYVIASSTYPDSDNIRTDNDIEIYCPYPFWIEEKTIEVSASSGGGSLMSTDKGYVANTRYTYSYSYAVPSGAVTATISHYAPSDFRMVIYGPAASVSVTIADHVYAVNYAVESGEYMVIDSRASQDADHRCYIVDSGGNETNVFNYRDASSSIFTKIPAGTVVINYSRSYAISLTVFIERSEPRDADSD